jgi:hypothetical protein
VTESEVDEITFEALKLALGSKGKMRFRIASGSMEPIIPTNSEIEVFPLDRRPEKFDIIVFWTRKILMCHYVLHLNVIPSHTGENLIITGGLNNAEDWPISANQVLGIVRSPELTKFHRFTISFKRWLRRRT